MLLFRIYKITKNNNFFFLKRKKTKVKLSIPVVKYGERFRPDALDGIAEIYNAAFQTAFRK